ncbi:MAG: hypothetical protein DI535_14075 [Citrobacter freundii]|nr:MAG: hypothetical protein DI535_14075 [Citrobacter freundii]
MLRQYRIKATAVFFLLVFGFDLLYPVTAMALTSGPTQPEMTKFEPAGATNLVDLFSGDLKYNLPLLDVGGYPLNLSYQSGTTMEEEASWVGMGWTLNPGSVSRNMRGLPDDFSGENTRYPLQADLIKKEHSQKEFKKVGGSIVLKPEIFSWEIGSANLRMSVYKDNYYGMGASVGAGVSFSLAEVAGTSLTAGLGLNSDNRDGVSLSPNLSISYAHQDRSDNDYVSASLSGGLTYNSRAGLKDVSLSQSFSTAQKVKADRSSITLSERTAINYFGQSYTPSVNVQKANTGFTFNFDVGPSVLPGYLGAGGTGFTFSERIIDPVSYTPAYGYLNYLKGRDRDGALLDFNREKDGVFLPKAPAIATPVATNDFFMVTGQTGSNQFRPYFGGNYIVGDKRFVSRSANTSIGLTGGFGINSFQGGGRIERVNGETSTGRWIGASNGYMNTAKYQSMGLPDDEPVAMKRVGEKTIFDNDYFNSIGADATSKVEIGRLGSSSTGTARTIAKLKSRDNQAVPVTGALRRQQRERKNHVLSYLTAEQAELYGLDKTIKSYIPNTLNSSLIHRWSMEPPAAGQLGNYRKGHHISEMTVTDNEGKRMVYGIPVYNVEQQEMTFAVKNPVDLTKTRRTGLIDYTGDPATNHKNGRDQLYTNTTTPAYATSFLLTGILSPDYVDKTNNGITDDDLGTAVKFNYTKFTGAEADQLFQWRAPYQAGKANFNEGFISDTKDDKASIVYGRKELWYMHSIESKTMIAFFELSDREDGLGVTGRNGGKNTSVRQKKLDRIKLYSKAEWYKNPATAVPIKVVHFEYDYSLYPSVPNNSNAVVSSSDGESNMNIAKGKLTLKRVYFTFGNSSSGKSNPYTFGYDMRMIKDLTNIPVYPPNPDDQEVNDEYTERQSDRWGTYKQRRYNTDEFNPMNNSEYPYSLQLGPGYVYDRKALIDRFASKWQLNSIVTPTGSVITAEYESDDYAYVQNRRAMQMFMISGFVMKSGGVATNGLIDAAALKVKLASPVASKEEFIRDYLTETDGTKIKKMFFKAYVDLTNSKRFEYVNGYADIIPDDVQIESGGAIAVIPVKSVGDNNPISKAAWQMLYADLPQFAYDNYDNSDVGDGVAAIRSIISSIGNIGEFTKSPDERAKKKRFASSLDFKKSMVRLYSPKKMKLGGGARVSKITISDEWESMAGVGNPKSVTGQRYSYTVKDNDGRMISSGVASYEPAAGNEENPFHEPVSYTEKVQWSSDRYHFIEKPFCETYFPAASVGYSSVKVTSFGNGDGPQDSPVGYTENEFYTAKDFPVIVDNLPIETMNIKNSLLLKLFTARSVNKMAVSQGFKVELNDMHGREKSVKVYNKGGDLITSSSYYYSVKDERAAFKELKNEVPVLKENGDIQNNTTVGVDVDFVTDMRESIAESTGQSVGAYFGAIYFFFFTLPHGAAMVNTSETINNFHASSAVKVIQRYGILTKTVTTQNGSTVEAENLLWDGQTGEPILTRTQNEFDKNIYSFSYPAYQGFEGMGAAYKNDHALLNLQTSSTGAIQAAGAQPVLPYLFPGDVLYAVGSEVEGLEVRGWVMKDANGVFRLIDEKGEFIQTTGLTWMVGRSGRRNILGAGSGTVVTLKDPRVNGKIDMAANKAIIDAKAIAYKDWWEVPVNKKLGIDPTIKCITVQANNGLTKAGNYSMARTDNVPGPALREFNECTGEFLTAGVYSWNGGKDDLLNYYDWKERAYIDFGSVLPAGPNIQIVSATLSLYGHNTVGANESWLERVTSLRNCNNTLTWDTKPTTTTTGRLTLSQSVTTAQNYTGLNVLDMFNNWHTTRDISEFRVSVRIKDETYSGAVKEMQFHGGDWPGFTVNPATKPTLVVCYIDNGDVCLDPVNTRVNPYYEGILGNWRPYINYVYTVDRAQNAGNGAQQGGTDIRNSGYYKEFAPFWTWNNGKMERTFTDGPTGPLANNSANQPIVYTDPLSRWTWSAKSLFYDQKGNESETVDALNRYSSALFGYQQSMSTAVGANSRQREIAFDGFEDYGFVLPITPPVACELQRHLDFGLVKQGGVWQTEGAQITSAVSHTGKYSLQLNGTTSITKQTGADISPAYPLGFDANNRFVLLRNSSSLGFAPIQGKKYLLSFWVNDHDDYAPSNKVQGVTVKINGADMDVSTIIVPRVEGWKRLEIPFTAGADFRLEITGSGKEIDDIRFLPKDGQMTSFVYDDATLRLMAQLDENNFATIYEYDDEGIPVRVKKETERGVMTLKENRQFIRKQN